ncbi:MAG: RNA polymerase sigma factor RpoE, partial [Arenimonas sp.]|nr:RNA polymerase sigma factor RpoE [Arenimonas sp.]
MGDNEQDLALVKRVQAGENAAFDLLVRKYQHRIGAVVYRFVPDHAEVQDIVQEAFIRAYRAMAGFRGDAQFYTWLYRIAVNT